MFLKYKTTRKGQNKTKNYPSTKMKLCCFVNQSVKSVRRHHRLLVIIILLMFLLKQCYSFFSVIFPLLNTKQLSNYYVLNVLPLSCLSRDIKYDGNESNVCTLNGGLFILCHRKGYNFRMLKTF